MRVRMFKRGPLAPGAEGPARWVPHGTYSGGMTECIRWLPRAEGGRAAVGREFLLVALGGGDLRETVNVLEVATVRIEEPPPPGPRAVRI